MKVSIMDIKTKFHELINGKTSRDEVDRWAYSIIKKSNVSEIEFIPPEKKEIIWNYIMYFYGIDLQEKSNDYIHSTNDIKNTFNKFCSEHKLDSPFNTSY